jgi:hypothetical protein
MVRIVTRTLAATIAASALAACTGGQTVGPTVHSVSASKFAVLEFAVGTANFQGTYTGLNTVVTFRESSGASAALVDTPTIVGPSGFTVPGGAIGAGSDAGTNSITSLSQTATSGSDTFGTSGGAFEYGFAPANTSNSGTANYPQFGGSYATALNNDATSSIITGGGKGALTSDGITLEDLAYTYPEPLYVGNTQEMPYVVGPPAVPDFHSANYPSGFLGEPSGFTAFEAPPVAGAYGLTVVLPSATGTAATYTASGTLSSTAPLAQFVTPTIAADAAADGGATVTYTLPTGVTNAIIYAIDVSASSGAVEIYSQLETASGTWTIPATQGPGGAAPFAAGDIVFAYAAGFDYNPLATGLGTPTSLVQSPTLPAQADVTLSGVDEEIYGGAAAATAAKRKTR